MLQIKTYRQGEADTPLQDLRLSYDPVGNVLSLDDQAQPTQWRSNTRIEAVNRYEYDTLYQLTVATGREHSRSTAGQAAPQVLFGAPDEGLWRPYTQRYTYDEAGNLTHLRHASGIGGGYTRRMTLAPDSNRACLAMCRHRLRSLMATATSARWAVASRWPGTCATSWPT
ncbi:hypothetical protein [Pseudomonas cyclaminis]|uniref:hypothetical protein n=1 Tax=Pseudomonas cyclaminis TaxID=2781239 RepID=UPI001FE82DD8|nr:hypothetical protein [Pseudomonas cyclaminis]